MKPVRIKILFFVLCLFAASCTGLKYVPENEKLYTGADIKLESYSKIKKKKPIIEAANKAIRPTPNKKFLASRPKLWMYYVAGNPTKKKGFRSWLKKQGEPPVYLSTVKPGETAKFVDAKLFNIGIFKSATEFKVVEKKKTARVQYTCHVHQPYKIMQIIFPAEDDMMSELIRDSQKKSLVKVGDNYNLDILKQERERIDIVLKENGYFYFNPDYLLFKADSSDADKTVVLELSIKEETPYQALLIYRINDITVDADYSLEEERQKVIKDTMTVDDLLFKYKEKKIRFSVIARSVFFRRNDIYSRRRHNQTLNRLMTMGNYKFVNVKFFESDTANPGFLNARVLLTPMPKRTFRSEIDLVSKSNDFIGPRLNVNYRNRNTFNGAELFNLTLGGSVETQFTGKYKGLYSFEINPKAELYVPGFIVPFRLKKQDGYYLPKTKFALGYNYLSRVNYFNLRSFQFQYGYKWKENIKKDHELNPVNINLTSIAKESPEFLALLEKNPFLKKSYDEQFIAGATYSFTFNEQVIPEQQNQFYFNTTAETAGNFISLAKQIQTGRKASAQNPHEIAGVAYSQFARLTIDARNYFNFKNKNKIAIRLYTGIGKPYGNSSTLPYIKQFFSGGPNSVRAFKINSLGPGTYHQRNDNKTAFLERGGDIKVETNAEYRCNLFGMLKGAAFIDAGNVWLLKGNPDTTATPFSISRFADEMAVGAGVGLRFDATFFVLRFDLATPLKKPWLDKKDRWVLNQMDWANSAWRSDNLILNIAIGYPF